MSARRLLRNLHDHLSQIKAHKSALDESRKDLSTLIDNAYYASHIADDILSVESMITKIDSSVMQMSQRLKSLANSDNNLAKQDNSQLMN